MGTMRGMWKFELNGFTVQAESHKVGGRRFAANVQIEEGAPDDVRVEAHRRLAIYADLYNARV